MRDENVKVITRHGSKCPHKAEGQFFRDCRCKKSLLVTSPEERTRFRLKTRLRDWDAAERFRREYLNRVDSALAKDLDELDTRRADDILAKHKDKGVLIETAVVAYIGKLRSDRRAEGTIVNAQSFLGYTDPQSSLVQQSGKFLKWINGQVIKPRVLTDLTPETIERFVASWNVGDTTENSQRQRLKAFLKFCVKRRWLEWNPASVLDNVKVRKGNRTAAFSPEQYTAILEACQHHETNIPGKQGEDWKQRLFVFIRLLRESGMDLADACQFQPSQLDNDTLSYRRQKTGIQTWPILLPADLVADLRSIPDQYGLAGAAMPFRTSSIALKEDCRNWRLRIQSIFKEAGITSVQTDVGTRAPHPKQFRDTFAIQTYESGVDMITISKMLGHKNAQMTIDYYMPKCKSRDDQHIALLRKAMAKREPKQGAKVLRMRKA